MGSSSKRRQTFSKMTRERAVKEKREAKQEKKEERKRAAAEAAAAEAAGEPTEPGLEGSADEEPGDSEPAPEARAD